MKSDQNWFDGRIFGVNAMNLTSVFVSGIHLIQGFMCLTSPEVIESWIKIREIKSMYNVDKLEVYAIFLQ